MENKQNIYVAKIHEAKIYDDTERVMNEFITGGILAAWNEETAIEDCIHKLFENEPGLKTFYSDGLVVFTFMVDPTDTSLYLNDPANAPAHIDDKHIYVNTEKLDQGEIKYFSVTASRNLGNGVDIKTEPVNVTVS